ncbi:DUF922 domain-containing protein [Flagellimonas zhangzhouensis]|uniref:DUF922 domain-containing protein n=1 Tax=Flagellimonas zhangzhouensis TaxID=1073328 RepID=A0A1H2Y0Y0_9FLAO|nr:DUF922 domain-containing protein [Allomuricauda zhangzhouensis]SDQ94004.1 protein of unknown function [Allomuricauda zhangzhouensis]SDW98635.1 protein of unknown function [Allomuricauda zhangzhouensis]
MGKITAITCLFFLSFVGFAQEIEEGVAWGEMKRLTWNDFKGKVPVGVGPAATTASGISYSYSANLLHHEVKLDFEVNAYFYPNESWYKPEECTDNTLAHEQLHFDISELFARKMRNKLERTSFSDDVKAEIRKIYKDILNELQDYQERYDWETNFSRNREKQLEWNQKIAKALKEES